VGGGCDRVTRLATRRLLAPFFWSLRSVRPVTADTGTEAHCKHSDSFLGVKAIPTQGREGTMPKGRLGFSALERREDPWAQSLGPVHKKDTLEVAIDYR
jgi:hypothetical protein